MNDEQITRLLVKTQRRLWLRHLRLPVLCWGAASAVAGASLGTGFVEGAAIFGGLLSLPALQTSSEAAKTWREFKRAPALRLWREITDRDLLIASPCEQTKKMARSIRGLYETDWRGEVLPLRQAARLLLIYDLQRRRLESIHERLNQLEVVRGQLRDRGERLQQLGDQTPLLSTSLDNLSSEIAGLERLGEEVFGSCHRLEDILLSVGRAVQVKQLHREIVDLTSVVSPRTAEALGSGAPEITDIERQIGREIETFLQLERETDAHLRDV